MDSDRVDRQSKPAGLPHSVTPGSLDVCSSPGLFAAYRDLLRQAAPRHPPWTLVRLTILPLHPSLCPGEGSEDFRLPESIFKEPRTQRLFGGAAVEVWGFEPQTYGLQSHRSGQLSYTPRDRLLLMRLFQSSEKKSKGRRGEVCDCSG